MVDLNYILKCPVDNSNFTDTNKNGTFSDKSSDVNVLGFGILIGVVVALILDVIINFDVKVIELHENMRMMLSETALINRLCNTRMFSRILLLTFLILTLPVVILFLLLAFSYKILCSVIIKRKDKLFVGFLDSFDVFWSLEDDSSKSIINVLGIVESKSPDAIASDIKQKLKNIHPNEMTRKIFYRRNEKFGFYYWRRYKNIDIDEYVEVVEITDKSVTRNSNIELEDLMTDLQNQALPYGDEGLFKILITRQRVGNYDKEKGEYGIIFRIHHSVGDGVALVEFLCHTLADQSKDHSTHMFSFPDISRKGDSPYNILDMMHKLFEIPVCFVDGILRKPDKSALHGPSLSGKKVFKWTEPDKNLLVLIKDIKDNSDKLTFSDILLAVLSTGLRNFFSEKMAVVPEDVAVVLPVRFPKSTKTNEELLTNDFSVTILDLPIKEDGSRVTTIKNRCNKLRQSADPLTNYYFLKLVTGIFPISILQLLLNSSQATMVFSNMPGPEQLSICKGNALKELVFFVPHKGTTGLGVTALCYGGTLRFAAMADTALVPTASDLAVILKGMVREIKRLHNLYGDCQTQPYKRNKYNITFCT